MKLLSEKPTCFFVGFSARKNLFISIRSKNLKEIDENAF